MKKNDNFIIVYIYEIGHARLIVCLCWRCLRVSGDNLVVFQSRYEMERVICEHLKLLGCRSSAEIAFAYQVYLELFDVKLMHDVVFYYNIDINQIYLTAKASKNSVPCIFVPHPSHIAATMPYIEKLQRNLCTPECEQSITLVCIEEDSTMVFYTFFCHLIESQNPEILTRPKTREERKAYLDSEIRRNRNRLLLEFLRQRMSDD